MSPPELSLKKTERNPKIAVVLHLFYLEQIDLFAKCLSNIQASFDCFISVKAGNSARVSETFRGLHHLNRLEVKQFPNIGRDMAPFFVGFGHELSKYNLVLKLHSKKSPHNDQLKEWLNLSLNGLAGSACIIGNHRDLLCNENIGITSIPPPKPVSSAIEINGSWGHQYRNFYRCARERERLGLLDLQPDERFSFPAGSMFWCRTEVLKPLIDLNLRWSSFDREAGQIDGTLAHALERLIGLVCTRKLGLQCRTVWPPAD